MVLLANRWTFALPALLATAIAAVAALASRTRRNGVYLTENPNARAREACPGVSPASWVRTISSAATKRTGAPVPAILPA